MSVPKTLTIGERIKAWLTWATVEEACGGRPIPKYKVLFRRLFKT